jgi:hypothetical protein
MVNWRRFWMEFIAKLLCHFQQKRDVLRLRQHQDGAKARPTDFGEHGGMGFGPMRRNAKFSTSRLIVGGIIVGTDAHPNREDEYEQSW